MASKTAKRRKLFYHGLPGKKYGVWNDIKKEFQFGIIAKSPYKATKSLIAIIGNDAYKWRFRIKELNESDIEDIKKRSAEYRSKTNRSNSSMKNQSWM